MIGGCVGFAFVATDGIEVRDAETPATTLIAITATSTVSLVRERRDAEVALGGAGVPLTGSGVGVIGPVAGSGRGCRRSLRALLRSRSACFTSSLLAEDFRPSVPLDW